MKYSQGVHWLYFHATPKEKKKKKKNNKQTKECIKILINTNKSESNKADNSADELTNIMLYILSTKEKQ